MPRHLKLNLQFFGGEPSETKKLLDQIQAEIKGFSTEMADLVKKQEAEIKNFGAAKDETANKIETLDKKYVELEKEYKKHFDEMNELAKKFNRSGFGGNGEPEQIKTAGQMFLENEQVKQWIKAGEPQYNVAIPVKSFGRKDLTSAAGSAGTIPVAYRRPDIVLPPTRPTIRTLLNAMTTTANAIEYVRESGFTNNAAIRAEGAAAAQSDITYELKSASVRTISHFMAASREILNDAPRLRAMIDFKLRYGVELTEESQLLYGDGVGNNLEGIMINADVQDLGQKPNGSSRNHIDHIRKAITKAQLAQYPVTGLTLNPENWEEIELLKGGDGHYIWLNIAAGNEMRLFRVPVVPTPAVVKDDFLLGAFGLGAQLYDRENAAVRFTDSHSDWFTKGMMAIMGEERVALTLERPESFVKGKLTEAPA